MMRTVILAGTVLALAGWRSAGAMASDHRAAAGGRHMARFHAAAPGSMHHIDRGKRPAGVRGPADGYGGGASAGYQGAFIDLGPLGMTAACGSYSRGRPDYCGPRNGAPIDAWGR